MTQAEILADEIRRQVVDARDGELSDVGAGFRATGRLGALDTYNLIEGLDSSVQIEIFPSHPDRATKVATHLAYNSVGEFVGASLVTYRTHGGRPVERATPIETAKLPGFLQIILDQL